MNSIQKKILTLSAVVIFSMVVIWVVLTYYNQRTQEQYNDILQRYLRMNEVTNLSQDMVTALNNYLQDPTPMKLHALNDSKLKLLESKQRMAELRNEHNVFTLTNYMNMIDSLVGSTDLSINSQRQKNNEMSLTRFAEATRISKYISEMTLSLIDKELKTYDTFYRGIIQQSAQLKKMGFVIVGFISIVLVLFAYWFSLSITRPIQKLTFAARELSKGRFDRKIEVVTNDEISFLARTFDRMRSSINNLISEIQHKAQLESELQESRLLLKESQLRSLQSQINPHFLFNTLDTLSKKAYLEGALETSDLIVNVASLLRYNLRNMDRSVTLKDELNNLLQYVEIQKTRFADRMKFDLEVDESCLTIPIPSLALQPLIENAVIHAVEPMEDGGVIVFRALKHGDYVQVEIEDNGSGISDDKVKRILEEDSEQPQDQGHSTGIGFSNVVRRLRLFYGNDDVIRIISAAGQGTKVILQLPVERRSETGHEAAHRG
ncbi:sensor histidine kinase [Cohnella terricola]|uniref:histidine kinase n=1 Tax=Cohnella terricola TaxID=1289167 RepID=A0A559JN51_9BACL|nr:sensor histidine kinase [Cohnella terricola]TVY01296.1 HAMP domain-containing protein [Cohnella terricola]